MNYSRQEIYDKLNQIFVKYKKRCKNTPKSVQLCCMWSLNNPPDIIEGTAPFIDIETAFNVEVSDDHCFELYDMELDEASNKIAYFIKMQYKYSPGVWGCSLKGGPNCTTTKLQLTSLIQPEHKAKRLIRAMIFRILHEN
jgi:hypothetical protein